MALTFDALRKANIARLPEFKNSQGEMANSAADGSDWSLLEWAGAVAGEVGELANLLKKVKRGDLDWRDPAVRMSVAKEIADVQIYLDLLAYRAGIDLDTATIAKFNETSRKIKSKVRLLLDDWGDALYSPCHRCGRGRKRYIIEADGSWIGMGYFTETCVCGDSSTNI